MSVYHVGESVCPRSKLVNYVRYGENTFVPDMRCMIGKVCVIKRVTFDGQYVLFDDDSDCLWTNEMLNPIKTNKKNL